MKKLLSAMMIILLCMILVSCGGNTAGTGGSADAPETAEESAKETAEDIAKETEDTAEETEEEAAEASASAMEAAAQQAQEQKDLLAAFGSRGFLASVGAFETEDLDGNPVTEAYFGNADVTIVHIWATYCDPCLKEMENLGKMAESLPDNAQVLGIAADVPSSDAEEKELAKQILADNNIKFPSVVANDAFTNLLGNIVGVPTTFIVDSEGNVVGEPIVGSDVVGYKRMARQYLESIGK